MNENWLYDWIIDYKVKKSELPWFITNYIKCFLSLVLFTNWYQAPISHWKTWMVAFNISIRHLNQSELVDNVFLNNIFIWIFYAINRIPQIFFGVIWMFHPISNNYNHKCQMGVLLMFFSPTASVINETNFYSDIE